MFSFRVNLLVFCSFLYFAASAEDPSGPSLVPSITYSAWTNQTIYQFIAIRYAESPSGPRRFKAPVPAFLGPGRHFVGKYGRSCPVLDYLEHMKPEELEGDIEDCLHLSVYTKNFGTRSPVMFYIHGGAFESGSSRFHPPNYLLEKDIVLVVPEYRLGPLGFLSTRTDDVSGDAAMLDVQLALNWTQTYISRFGGDPKRVTVFGHSSGGAMVSALLISPKIPKHYFHRAIIQSGSALSTRAFDFNPIENAIDIATIAGCDPIKSITDCLMNVNPIKLLQAFREHFSHNIPKGFTKFGGAKFTFGQIFPQSPSELVQDKVMIRNIPVMGGVTKHDGTFILNMIFKYFGSPSISTSRYLYLEKFLKFLGLNDYSGATSGIFANTYFTPELLLSANLSELTARLLDIAGTVTIKAPLFAIIEAHAENFPNQTYLYTFDYKGQFTHDTNSLEYPYPNGVHHGDELIYLFPYPKAVSNLNAEDKRMAKRMIDLWTSFAESGVPRSDDMPKWPTLTKQFGPYLHIASNGSIGENFLDQYAIATHDQEIEKTIKAQNALFHKDQIEIVEQNPINDRTEMISKNATDLEIAKIAIDMNLKDCSGVEVIGINDTEESDTKKVAAEDTDKDEPQDNHEKTNADGKEEDKLGFFYKIYVFFIEFFHYIVNFFKSL